MSMLDERLCAASRQSHQPAWTLVAWPASLPTDAWCMSPELVSLAGTAAWSELDESLRRRLAFFEAVGFFSMNVHGESSLVEGVARRLHRPGHELTTPYLHHFLDEENKHMMVFSEFCLRYAGKLYPARHIAVDSERTPGEEEVLFFGRVVVFEEVVDHFNRKMAVDERLHPVVRRIHALHHADEKRHLVFGRRLLQELVARHAGSSHARAEVSEYLAAYLAATWRQLFHPHVYRDAGLSDPWALADEAHASSRPRFLAATERLRRFLVRIGLEVA